MFAYYLKYLDLHEFTFFFPFLTGKYTCKSKYFCLNNRYQMLKSWGKADEYFCANQNF